MNVAKYFICFFMLTLFFASNHAFSNEAVLLKAKSYTGLHERKNKGALRSVTHVNTASTPWCAAFVNGVLRQMGIRGTGSYAAMSFNKYRTRTKSPSHGDIVVIRRKGGSGAHVGFFAGYVKKGKNTYVKVLGGNQSNKVTTSTYPTSKVISYRKV